MFPLDTHNLTLFVATTEEDGIPIGQPVISRSLTPSLTHTQIHKHMSQLHENKVFLQTWLEKKFQ
jgi:hypothetical protein